eukprot:3712171-Rhodomonas_salina.2
MQLRACYDILATDVIQGALCPTRLPYHAQYWRKIQCYVPIRARCTMPSTDTAYAPTRRRGTEI